MTMLEQLKRTVNGLTEDELSSGTWSTLLRTERLNGSASKGIVLITISVIPDCEYSVGGLPCEQNWNVECKQCRKAILNMAVKDKL